MFLLSGLLAVLLGSAFGGQPRNLGKISFSGYWVLVVSLCSRGLFGMFDGAGPKPPYVSFVASLLPAVFLLYALYLNRSLPGSVLTASGTCMNASVIALNGGRMPVSLAYVSPDKILLHAEKLSKSLTHQALKPHMPLGFLADIYKWTLFGKSTMFSLGDAFIAAGVFWLVFVHVRGKAPLVRDGTMERENHGLEG